MTSTVRRLNLTILTNDIHSNYQQAKLLSTCVQPRKVIYLPINIININLINHIRVASRSSQRQAIPINNNRLSIL